MLTESQLRKYEQAAIAMAKASGAILLEHFSKPLEISYKSENNRNPVTNADKASDEYLRTTISKQFPHDGILSEESEQGDDQVNPVIWVIDPLDGTSNFLKGLPMFAVLISVLELGKPVVAAAFIPSIADPNGTVIHARIGAGSFENGRPLRIDNKEAPPRRMAAWPGYFLRMFSFHKSLRRRLGDVRVTGSAGYELALVARGIFDYVGMNGPWIWDVSAGLLIINEAGGVSLARDRRSKHWKRFDRFEVPQSGTYPTPKELRSWRQGVLFGTHEATSFIAPKTKIHWFFWRRLRQRWISKLRKS